MPHQATFLLVEDDPNDVALVRRAFLKAKVLNRLEVVTSGEKAMEYLSGDGKYANRAQFPLPSLVLLDLKMPGIDGFDTLRWIRQQPDLATLRVVALTSSDRPADINLAYQCGANSFLVKPTDFDRFVQVSQALSGYWVWLDRAAQLTAPSLSIAIGAVGEQST